MVVYDSQRASQFRPLVTGDKVMIQGTGKPWQDGAIGKIIDQDFNTGACSVRVPRGRCPQLCSRNPLCVKACNILGSHKGWCRTKNHENGCGILYLNKTSLVPSDSPYYHPAPGFVSSCEEELEGAIPVVSPPPATIQNPPAAQNLGNGAKRQAPSSSNGEGVDFTGVTEPVEKKAKIVDIEAKLKNYMVVEMGLMENFAATVSAEIVELAQEKDAFHPFARKMFMGE